MVREKVMDFFVSLQSAHQHIFGEQNWPSKRAIARAEERGWGTTTSSTMLTEDIAVTQAGEVGAERFGGLERDVLLFLSGMGAMALVFMRFGFVKRANQRDPVMRDGLYAVLTS